MVPLVLVHVAVIFYATRQGMIPPHSARMSAGSSRWAVNISNNFRRSDANSTESGSRGRGRSIGNSCVSPTAPGVMARGVSPAENVVEFAGRCDRAPVIPTRSGQDAAVAAPRDDRKSSRCDTRYGGLQNINQL